MWVVASGALSGCLLGLNDETTVAALPVDLLVTLEVLARLDTLEELEVAHLVLVLGLGDIAIDSCNGLEALLLGDVSELGVQLLSLAVLTISGSLEVLSGGADDTCGESCSNL